MKHFKLPSIFAESASATATYNTANVPLNVNLMTDLESFSIQLGESVDAMVERLNGTLAEVNE